MNVTELALSWAKRDVHVFPVAFGGKGKTPLRGCDRCSPASPAYEKHDGHTCPCHEQGLPCHGLLAATTDPDRIRAMFSREGVAAVGINCGTSGLAVIDCDTIKSGDEGLDWEHGGFHEVTGEDLFTTMDIFRSGKEFSATASVASSITDGVSIYQAILTGQELEHVPTLTVRTPSGGIHYIYRDPTLSLPSTSDVHKVDIKAQGGYVIAAGSATVKGEYRITEMMWPPAEAPEWIRILMPDTTTPFSGTRNDRAPGDVEVLERSDPARYVRAALEKKAEMVASARIGEVYTTIRSATMSLAPLVNGKALEEAEVIKSLEEAVCRTRAPERVPDVRRCLESAMGKTHAVQVLPIGHDDGLSLELDLPQNTPFNPSETYLRVIRLVSLASDHRQAVVLGVETLSPLLHSGVVDPGLLVRHLVRVTDGLSFNEVKGLCSAGFQRWVDGS